MAKIKIPEFNKNTNNNKGTKMDSQFVIQFGFSDLSLVRHLPKQINKRSLIKSISPFVHTGCVSGSAAAGFWTAGPVLWRAVAMLPLNSVIEIES